MKRLFAIAAKHYHEDSMSIFLYRVLRALIAQYTEIVKWVKLKIFWLKHKDQLVTKIIQGNKMCLSMRDKGISSGLIAHGFWEPLATKILNQSIHEGDIVVDVG